MDRTEKQIINELFGKLELAERQEALRDEAAEDLIKQRLARQPAAPYYMAQVIAVQTEALIQAQQRLQELEAELTQQPEEIGFLAGLFGEDEARTASSFTAQTTPLSDYRGRPGFLGGALETAIRVSGSMMTGSFLSSMIFDEKDVPISEAPTAAGTRADDPSDDVFDSDAEEGFDDDSDFDL